MTENIFHSGSQNPIQAKTEEVAGSPGKGCDISFIIVSWNATEYLSRCLASLRNGVADLRSEVIVVDNGSTDGSWQMARSHYPEVRLLRNAHNAGFAGANNQGIDVSNGRYVCLINSDVEVFPDTARVLLEYMDAHPDVGILGPKVLNSDLSLQHSCRTLPTLRDSFFRALKLDTTFPNSGVFGRHQMMNWDYSDTREVGSLSGCFWVIRRKALEDVGQLDTRFFIYGEDMDFCRRLHEVGWKVIFYPEALIVHHGGASSGSDPARFWIEMQRANLQYWSKYNGRASTFAYYSCLLLHNLVRVIAFGGKNLVGRHGHDGPQQKLVSSRRGLLWLLSPETVLWLTGGRC
ncbi:MAG: glycosyltransferase family 2 protein [Syntrophobacteraceae bacterium]|nr:glycosyltransferase family 2 protein [Syntrophobacteraceae bacterium]